MLAKLLNDYRLDPVRFVRDVLGVEDLESWQERALRVMATDRARLAVRSGHGVGKTTLLAWLILWFGSTSNDAKIGVTAPASPQIEVNLWPELRKWHKAMAASGPVGLFLSQQIEIVEEKVRWSNGNRCSARTARPDQPEAIQGLHADDAMVLVDEASGVPDAVFEASSGALSTPGAKICMTGNPTRPAGYFHRAFHAARASWTTMKVSQLDVSPKRADVKFREEAEQTYGKESNYYRVRVLGEFPTAADDTVIPLELLEQAFVRDVVATRHNIVWGVDVARFGDDATTVAIRRGNTMPAQVIRWQGLDTMQTVGRIVRLYEDTVPEELPTVITVDVIGMGAGVVDRLRELNYPVHGINVAESAASSDLYLRMRDELWFKAREWLQAKDCRMARDDELAGELVAPTYTYTSSGRIVVEPKVETKKRLGHSPDRADAWVLTFALGETRPKVDAPWRRALAKQQAASGSWMSR